MGRYLQFSIHIGEIKREEKLRNVIWYDRKWDKVMSVNHMVIIIRYSYVTRF